MKFHAIPSILGTIKSKPICGTKNGLIADYPDLVTCAKCLAKTRPLTIFNAKDDIAHMKKYRKAFIAKMTVPVYNELLKQLEEYESRKRKAK